MSSPVPVLQLQPSQIVSPDEVFTRLSCPIPLSQLSPMSPVFLPMPRENTRAPRQGASKKKHQPQQLLAEPRSFQELQNERLYLTDTIRRQDERAKKLLGFMSEAEKKLSTASTPAESRKARRDITLLKAKLNEIQKQEKLTWVRLSDLYVEIHGRERVLQVQQHSAYESNHLAVPLSPFQAGFMSMPGTPMTPGLMPHGWSQYGTSVLPSPLTPGFAPWNLMPPSPCTPFGWSDVPSPFVPSPTEMAPDAPSWKQVQYDSTSNDEQVDEVAPDNSQSKGENPTKEVKKSDADEKVEAEERVIGRLGSLSLNTTYVPINRNKRMSMPCLTAYWQDDRLS